MGGEGSAFELGLGVWESVPERGMEGEKIVVTREMMADDQIESLYPILTSQEE